MLTPQPLERRVHSTTRYLLEGAKEAPYAPAIRLPRTGVSSEFFKGGGVLPLCFYLKGIKHMFAVIGDIHGCAHTLEALIKRLPADVKNNIITTGDVIDRGKYSKAALDILDDINAKIILGNHEDSLQRYFKHGKAKLFDERSKDQLKDTDFQYRKFPTTYAIGDYVVIHAGLRTATTCPVLQSPKSFLLHARTLSPDGKKLIHIKNTTTPQTRWEELYTHKFPKIIYGHTAREEPKVTQNTISIDTAAVYGGKLTAVIIDDTQTHRFISQPTDPRDMV